MVLYSTTLLCRCFLRFLLARIVRASRPAAHRARGCWRWSPRWRAGGWPESTRDQMSRDTVLARTTPVAYPAPLGAPLNSSLTVSFLVRLPSELCRAPGKSQDATTRPQNQLISIEGWCGALSSCGSNEFDCTILLGTSLLLVFDSNKR